MTANANSQAAVEFTQIAVTRPKNQAETLIFKLNQSITQHKATLTSCSIPLLEIHNLAFQLPQSQPYNGIIFISSNAVKQFFKSETALSLLNSCAIKTPLLGVGENTAACIQAHLKTLTPKLNFAVSFPTEMNAEGLLNLPILQSVAHQHWLLVKGQGGRELIETTLKQRAAQVTAVDVYKRAAPSNTDQIMRALNQPTLWLVTSTAALDSLYAASQSQNLACDKVALVISSDRLHSYAQQLGFKIVAQSKGASEPQLIQCIQSLL
ncbi:uroporphyrinogen-III synthase [Aliikangiella sp. IMCC44653]